MDASKVRVVAVIGAGTMGSQIAQQCALCGIEVILIDNDENQLRRAESNNRKLLLRRVEKGKMDLQTAEDALNRVASTTSLEGAEQADFVIEAIVEQLEAKRALFSQLDSVCGPDAVIATNSSTIGVSRLAVDMDHRERAINMHFFHPALVMQLVEVMTGPETSQSAVDRTMSLARQIGKEPVLIQREVYGLLVNRILGAIKREALWLAEEGYATPQDIDRAVKLGLNHPMGPFELADFSGVDVFYYASLERYRETGDEQYKASKLLEEMVKAGNLGRKTGKGFYDYTATGGDGQ